VGSCLVENGFREEGTGRPLGLRGTASREAERAKDSYSLSSRIAASLLLTCSSSLFLHKDLDEMAGKDHEEVKRGLSYTMGA
jgi:hypothetical protein